MFGKILLKHSNKLHNMSLLRSMLKIFAVVMLLLVLGMGDSRKKKGVIALLDTIDEYCEGEDSCNNDVMDDLIWYLSGEAYDAELDAGTEKATLLLESIDDKCDNDASCMDPLLNILTERVLDDPMMN